MESIFRIAINQPCYQKKKLVSHAVYFTEFIVLSDDTLE